MEQHRTRWPLVQWLPWCCLILALRESSSCVDNATARLDSGGDNCSFYEEQPAFCGCCDTPSFVAERDCCACGQSPQGAAAWWTEVFHAWPQKAVSLHLEGKGLQGPLPPTLNLLVNLKSLRLKRNDLTGNVPAELGNLSGLEYVDLSENQLSGSLPAELGQLSQLQELHLENNQLSGSLPAELGDLSHLRKVDLKSNQFSGSLPAELGRLSQLQDLRLNSNQLSGSLPAELGQLAQLQDLRLWQNQLSGSLPAELGQLSQLQVLYLHDNQLSGSLPAELGQLSQLQTLYLYDNQLSGSLPAELGQLSQLRALYLENNQLSGSLPAELGRLSQLGTIHLDNNQLSGGLPAELGQLLRLNWLRLDHNQLSGTLPAELGQLSQLQALYLENNQLSGTLPAELGQLSQLQALHLDRNQLSGTLPAELGQLSQLQTLHLDHNQLEGGIPNTFTNMSQLRLFSAKHNRRFCGSTDAITGLPSLRTLELRGCCFQTFARLPAGLEVLDLGENHFAAVPESFRELNLKTLLLDNNRIRWDTSSVVPLSQRLEGVPCLWNELPRPPQWMNLVRLDVSSNSFGVPVYDFLATLRDLPLLVELRAADNQLSGPVPALAYQDEFIDPCLRFLLFPPFSVVIPPGFPALVTLDLSGNNITDLHAAPPPSLVQLYLARNRLTTEGLSDRWWRDSATARTLQLVDVQGNPALRLPIRLPIRLDAGSSCEDSRAEELAANPLGWVPAAAGASAATGSECTSLCRRQPQVLVDSSAQEEVLCRCSGGQGRGLNCTACPHDSYSDMTFENGGYSRSCLECPANSQLRFSQGACFADCECSAGFFMVQIRNDSEEDVGTTPCSRLAPTGKCLSCDLFRTSLPGSRKASDCFCNGDSSNGGWQGLLQRQGKCGCADGYHMNFQERTCVPCQAQEDCADWTRSLEPPSVKPGFWALPAPARGSDGLFGNFSRHSIWRCQSTITCPGNSTCGNDLVGTACSLCRGGYFRTPAGSCAPCSQGPSETRLLLGACLPACMIFPILAHLQLRSGRGEPQGLALALRSVRTSLKQLLKFMQVLGLIWLYSVEWPPVAASVFTGTRAFYLDSAAWLGVACLDAQQQESMPLALGFRWMLPVAGLVVTCSAALLVTASGLVLGSLSSCCCKRREARIRRLLRFGPVDVLRVLLFFLQLFFPSLLKNALLPLTCARSPNGLFTMTTFPAVTCTGGDFWTVASIGMAQSILLSLCFPLLLFFVWKHINASRTLDVLEERRRGWAFVFADFRPERTSWLLVATCKDTLLNLIGALLPGLGTAQLLATSVVSGLYGCAALTVSPYPDASNSTLETCTALAVAALCLFTAGVGFQSEPDMPGLEASVAGGRGSSGYNQRALSLVFLQGLCLACPMAIFVFQVLMVFPKARRCVPRCMRPLSEEQREEWTQDFAKATAGGRLPRLLAELDSVDFANFRQSSIRGRLASRALTMERTGLERSDEEASQTEEESVPALHTRIAALSAEIAALRSLMQSPSSQWGSQVDPVVLGRNMRTL